MASVTAEQLNAYAAIAAAAVALVALLSPVFWYLISRPVLAVDFENRKRWRRQADVGGGVVGLFFRVRVTNKGWKTATMVAGFLGELQRADGRPELDVDPFMLHWAGTPYGAGGGTISLLPGQSEYLDVFAVETKMNAPSPQFLTDTFRLVAQDATPRGILFVHTAARQTLRVLILSDNARGCGLELRMPAQMPVMAINTLSVQHRSVRRFRAAAVRWNERPPPQNVGGIWIAGAADGE